MSATTIRAGDLPLILAAAKMRLWNKGRTCQLCALSEAPTITVECRYGLSAKQRYRDAARLHGISLARVSPMQRGNIDQLFERVHFTHGRKEMLRTWRAGVRALQAEPRHVLNGGGAA